MSSTDKQTAEQLFRDNFAPTKCIRRDRELERTLVLSSKVEMALLSRLAAGVLDPWEGKLQHDAPGGYSCIVRLKDSTGCPKPHTSRYSLPPCNRCTQCRCFDSDPRGYASFRIGIATNRATGSWLGDITATASNDHPYPFEVQHSGTIAYPLAERERALRKDATGLAEFLYSLYERTEELTGMPPECRGALRRMRESGRTVVMAPSCPGPVAARLVHLFCLLSDQQSERVAVETLACRLGIRADIFDFHGWLDHRRSWRQYADMLRLSELNPRTPLPDDEWFAYATDAKSFVREVIHRNPRNATILPITAWTRESTESRYYLNLPAWEPCLYGLPNINARNDAPVFLTDAIELAFANQLHSASKGVAWASWYGEEEAVSRVNWDPLRGREVFYLIAQQAGCPRESAYRTAYAVYRALSRQPRTKLTFVDIGSTETGPLGSDPVRSILSAEEFGEYARTRLGLDLPPTIEGFAPKTMEHLAGMAGQRRRFLLEPLILERSTTLVYARTNVGKTWFALCLAVAITQGGTLFGRWRAKGGTKALYLDSEMDEESMGERMRLVSRMRFGGRKARRDRLKNLLYISRKRSGEDTDSFKQKTVEFVEKNGVSLVILDNLTAFTRHNDSAGAWEDVHTWIDCLRERNCAVLLVHHENKKGEQRGTSATANAVDNVVHLLPHESVGCRAGTPGAQGRGAGAEHHQSDGALCMRVVIDKGREIFGYARQPFVVTISPNSTPPRCDFESEDTGAVTGLGDPRVKRSYRTGTRRVELQGKALSMLRDGRTVREVAAELGISTSYIYGIPGRKEAPDWTEHQRFQQDLRTRRDDQILKLAVDGRAPKAIAGDLHTPLSTVRRTLEVELARKVGESAVFRRNGSPEEIARELRAQPEAVRKAIDRLKLRRARDLHAEGRTMAEIAATLELALDRVREECAAADLAEQKKSKRREALDNVRRLRREGREVEDIMGVTGLPRRTILLCLDRTDPARRKSPR